jgi:hypothetical protein
MVRALLDGRKTQTRRVMKPQPGLFMAFFMFLDRKGIFRNDAHGLRHDVRALCSPGDRLWVREAFRLGRGYDGVAPCSAPVHARVWHAADESLDNCDAVGTQLRPSIHMPRWASRLTLTVTDVRAERVADISDDDALAEGVIRSDPTPDDLTWYAAYAEEHGFDPVEDPMQPVWLAPGTRQGFGPRANDPQWGPSPRFAFRLLWDSLNEKRGFGWEANPWVWAYSFTVERRNIDARRVTEGHDG